MASAVALLALAGAPGGAHAGYYTYDSNLHAGPGSDAGWGFHGGSNYWMRCRWGFTDPGCPTAQGPRAYARPQQAIPQYESVRAQFTALPDTKIVGGKLWYTERQANYNYFNTNVKTSGVVPSDWNDIQIYSDSVASDTVRQREVSLPSNVQSLTVNLRTKQAVPASVVTQLGHNYFHVDRISVTILDASLPVVEKAGGALWADEGSWRSGVVSGDVLMSDAGLGLLATEVIVDDSYARGRVTLAGGTGYRPGLVVSADASRRQALQVDTTQIPDGIHFVRARAYDATTQYTQTEPAELRVDNSAPVVGHAGPGESVHSRRPSITISAQDPHSGLAGDPTATLVRLTTPGYTKAVSLTVGTPGSWVWEADAALDDGDYELRYGVTNGAGLVSSQVAAFNISDSVAPVISGLRPTEGAVVGESTMVGMDIADAGGVAASGIVVRLDGVELTGAYEEAAGTYAAEVSGLSAGAHRVEATVTDRAGNASTRAWTFTSTGVADACAGKPAPCDGADPCLSDPMGCATDPCASDPASCEAVPAKVRLKASKRRAKVRGGARLTLTVRATRAGAAYAKRRLKVSFGSRKWTVTTDARGRARITLKVRRSGKLRVAAGGSSVAVKVVVRR